MRQEVKNYNDIDITFEVVVAGLPIGGLAPTVTIKRVSDGLFYQSPAPGWAAPPVAILMVETDPANFPGQYTFTMNPADLVYAAGASGYIAMIVEPVVPIVEYVKIDQALGDAAIGAAVWNTDLTALITANQNLAAFMVTLIRNAIVCTEDSSRHLCNILHGPGIKFYSLTTPTPATRDASFAGRLGMFYDQSVGEWELVRIASLSNDGNDYFEITLLDGSSGMPNGIQVNDELIVLNANDPAVGEIMSAPMSSYSVDGTFGDWIRRTLSLRQNNMRVVWSTWSASGVPTDGLVLIYDSKADLLADSAPWALATGKYTIAQSFDGSGRPTAYTSVKDA